MMKPIASYPVWLSAFMLLGPFFMVSVVGIRNQLLLWFLPMAGAGMVMIALFFLSKRLHEQMEELASLRDLLSSRDEADRA